MIDLKSPADHFEAIAMLLGPIWVDAVAVGNFSADVIYQPWSDLNPRCSAWVMASMSG